MNKSIHVGDFVEILTGDFAGQVGKVGWGTNSGISARLEVSLGDTKFMVNKNDVRIHRISCSEKVLRQQIQDENAQNEWFSHND